MRFHILSEALRSKGVYTEHHPLYTYPALHLVVQLLQPFRDNTPQAELHRQQHNPGSRGIRLRAGSDSHNRDHVVRVPSRCYVHRQVGVSHGKGEPEAVAVSVDPVEDSAQDKGPVQKDRYRPDIRGKGSEAGKYLKKNHKHLQGSFHSAYLEPGELHRGF